MRKIAIGKAILLFPLMFSCASQGTEPSSTSYSIPEVTLPEKSLEDVEKAILEAKKLPKEERKGKAFSLYEDLVKDGYFKPTITSDFPTKGIAKTRYLHVGKQSTNSTCGLGHSVAVTEPIKGQDYLDFRGASIKTRDDLKTFLTQKGYVPKDEMRVPLGGVLYANAVDLFHSPDDSKLMVRPRFAYTVNRGLFRFAQDGEAIPDLAKSVAKAEDGVTYTITLGEHHWKNAQGENLGKIVASDFEYSYKTFWLPRASEYPSAQDRKSTRLNSSHRLLSRMPSSA